MHSGYFEKKISHCIWETRYKWLVIHLLLLQRQHLTKWFLLTFLGFTYFQSASIVLFDSFSFYSSSLYSSPPCPLPTHHPLEKYVGPQHSPLTHPSPALPQGGMLAPRLESHPQHTRLPPLAMLTYFWVGVQVNLIVLTPTR